MRSLLPIFIATLVSTAPGVSAAQNPDEDAPLDSDPIVGDDPLAEGATTAAPTVTTSSAAGEASIALDPSTSVGIGVGHTIPGTPAILIHKYFTSSVGIQAGPTFDLATIKIGPEGMQTETSIYGFGAVAGLAYRLEATDRFALNLLGGIEFGYASVSVDAGGGSADESGIDLRVSSGLQAEYFVFDKLSLYAQVGLTFSVLSDVGTARRAGAPLGAGDLSAIAFDIGPRSMLQTIGMTWWL